MKMIIQVNEEKCTGCRTCEVVCSFHHAGAFSPALARIRAVVLEEEAFFFPVLCQQCDEPACAAVCPTGGLVRDSVTGVVRCVADRCVGCKMCLLACPFGAILYDPDTGRVFKCDHCDGEPRCVQFCPSGALEYRRVEDAMADRRRQLVRRLQRAAAADGG